MDNIIEIYDENNEKKEYQLLAIIDKNYKYIIYTDIENKDFKNNLYAIKVNNIDDISDTIPITDDEWEFIEKEYKKLISKEK